MGEGADALQDRRDGRKERKRRNTVMTPPAERRTAVIMGASSGIGRATAEAFAKKSWSLVLAARSRVDLDIVASRRRTLAAMIQVLPTDVGDTEADRALADSARGFICHVHHCLHTRGGHA